MGNLRFYLEVFYAGLLVRILSILISIKSTQKFAISRIMSWEKGPLRGDFYVEIGIFFQDRISRLTGWKICKCCGWCLSKPHELCKNILRYRAMTDAQILKEWNEIMEFDPEDEQTSGNIFEIWIELRKRGLAGFLPEFD
jgi:hypothetical protein